MDLLASKLYKERMNQDTYRARLHRIWLPPRKSRGVDKKGLVIALIFLVAIALWAGERGDKMTQQDNSWREQPDLSAHIEIRPATKSLLETEPGSPVLMTGLSRALEDPRGRSVTP
jgi:hypothetical protein